MERKAHAPAPLLRLPNEILDTIFDLAHKPGVRPPLICRRLYPIQRRALYRRVEIVNYARLAMFCRVIAATPRLGGLAHELELLLHNSPNREPREAVPVPVEPGEAHEAGDDPDDEWFFASTVERQQVAEAANPPPPLVDQRDLATLFASLGQLQTLVVEGNNLEGEVIFATETLPSVWNRLEVLDLSGCELRSPAGLEPDAWLRQLARFPRLQALTLSEFDGDHCIFPPVREPVPVLASLEELCIVCNFCREWSGPNLRDLAPNLKLLYLEDSEPWWFRDALRTAPHGLKSLVVANKDPREEAASQGILDDDLPLFTQLEELELCAASFTPHRLLPTLRAMPNLLFLSFGTRTLVTDDFLHAIVSGPHRLTELVELELSHVSCRRDTFNPLRFQRAHERGVAFRLPSPIGLDPDEYLGYIGWFAPWYQPGCSTAGIVAAMRAGREQGLSVVGSGDQRAGVGHGVPGGAGGGHCAARDGVDGLGGVGPTSGWLRGGHGADALQCPTAARRRAWRPRATQRGPTASSSKARPSRQLAGRSRSGLFCGFS
ncbi:hypothetical protein DMC30DRAFT_51300 [Rhodotorula diobovata]|uniref:Uncharacterized protein n=1 Tax=Rhodotorula diobovata TaxID=5288 RepID=A0A5C5FNW1_9BASI|nr:hypothetical protein DMC30DRAFT_51300 [Rhodotorula diobovata]